MINWSILIITANFIADVVLSAALNASAIIDCTPSTNETGRAGISLCNSKPDVRGLEQPSYSMLIQAAYGLAAITILVVAYFIFRTMRFV